MSSSDFPPPSSSSSSSGDHPEPWEWGPLSSPVSECERLELDCLLDDLDTRLHDAPIGFLAWTTGTVLGCAWCAEELVDETQPHHPRPLRAAAVAAQWLLGHPIVDAIGGDIPDWLLYLTKPT